MGNKAVQNSPQKQSENPSNRCGSRGLAWWRLQNSNLIFPVIKCIKIYRLVLWCSPLMALETVAAQRFRRFLLVKATHSKNFQAQVKNPIFQKFAGHLRDVRDRSNLHQIYKARPQSWGRACCALVICPIEERHNLPSVANVIRRKRGL